MGSSHFPQGPVKIEKNIVAPSSKSLPSSAVIKPEIASDDESSHSEDKNVARSRVPSSNEKTQPVSTSQEEKHEINNNHAENGKKPASKKSRGRGRSSHRKKKKRRTISNIAKNDEQDQPPAPKAVAKGRKRKQMTDNEEEAPPKQKNDEPSQDNQQILLDDEFLNDDNLHMALRRSTRIRKAPTAEIPLVTSSPMKSSSQVSIVRRTGGSIESTV